MIVLVLLDMAIISFISSYHYEKKYVNSHGLRKENIKKINTGGVVS